MLSQFKSSTTMGSSWVKGEEEAKRYGVGTARVTTLRYRAVFLAIQHMERRS